LVLSQGLHYFRYDKVRTNELRVLEAVLSSDLVISSFISCSNAGSHTELGEVGEQRASMVVSLSSVAAYLCVTMLGMDVEMKLTDVHTGLYESQKIQRYSLAETCDNRRQVGLLALLLLLAHCHGARSLRTLLDYLCSDGPVEGGRRSLALDGC
jgi:hypothetical protein